MIKPSELNNNQTAPNKVCESRSEFYLRKHLLMTDIKRQALSKSMLQFIDLFNVTNKVKILLFLIGVIGVLVMCVLSSFH